MKSDITISGGGGGGGGGEYNLHTTCGILGHPST